MAITDDVKLRVYNRALRILGSRKLASLTEDRKPRRLLDDAWGANNEAVETCLEHADWNFASRTVRGAYDPSHETEFGFRRAYQKPDDFVRLTTMSADEYMRSPFTAEDYSDQHGYWMCDHDLIYIRYVSSGDDYGFNSGLWPESFVDYVAGYLAVEIAESLTNSTEHLKKAERAKRDAMTHAKSRDAMDEGTKFPPEGAWVRARGGHGRRTHRVQFG